VTVLADKSLSELLAAFASSAPTPAGGSASALASAIGVSLLMMAASLVNSRTNADDGEALAGAWRVLAPLQQELTAAVDRDHAAYGQVVRARSGSTTSPRDVAEASIQSALEGATAVPLQVIRMSSQALQQASIVAERCHRPAASDVRVAIGLIRAGLAGARSSADANLAVLTNSATVQAARTEMEQLSLAADRAADAAEQSLSAS
jgi:formiminotetrahydrofolate cyclodeaminase